MAALASLSERKPSTRKYECARCGKQQKADRMVFSHFTRNHYCSDVDGCAKRAKRKDKS